MEFREITIRRVSKIDADGDVLSLHLLLVNAALDHAWASRTRVAWEQGEIPVVSREGLIALKPLRGSGTDLDDIRHLAEDLS